MAEKGIIIDVGFAPQWKDFLNDIEKEFSKLDFDKYINLDDAFKKQADEVRQKLKDLKKEIDNVINGVGSNPVKSFNELNKSVKSLSGVVLNLAKAMPDGDKYSKEIYSITNSMEELSDQAQNAVDTINSLNNISVNKLDFKTQRDQLKELWGQLDKVYKILQDPRAKNKSNGIPYSAEDSEELISQIKAEYNVYLEISEQIENIQDETTLSAEEMDAKLNRAYLSLGKTISKLNSLILSTQKVGMSSSLEVDMGINIESIKLDIDEQFNEVVDYINTAKARIQNEFTQLGGNEDLESWFTKRGKASGGIKIPISLDSNSRKKLYDQTIDVINKVQNDLNEPILVEVQLVSAYQSRGNQAILSQIQEELNNIKDGEITQKLQGLIDKMNKRVENAFIFNIHVNTQNATNQIRHFKKEIKDEIADIQKLLTINPEFELTPEIRQKLVDEINKVQTDNPLKINLDFGLESEDLQKELLDLNNIYKGLEAIKSAVDAKSAAFIEEGKKVDFVSDKEQRDLDVVRRWVERISQAVKEKSKAFIDSGKIVDKIANQEQDSLNKVKVQVAVDNYSDIEQEINSAVEALNKLIATGTGGDKLVDLLKNLRSSFLSLSNDKSAEKIKAFANNLKEIQTAIKPLSNIKNNTFVSSIQDILNKGEELKTFAEILKSTKKELKNATEILNNQDKSDIGKLNLENYSDIIQQRALNNISDIDYKLMSQSLEATSEGLVKVTTLIKTANGEYVKYIHTTTDGEEIQQQKIESGTASILKQAQAIERLNAKAEDNKELKRIGEVEPGTEKWEELVALIESFGIKLKDVSQIIQTIDQEGYESFQVFHGDGLRTTLGMNSQDILYEKNSIADLTDTTKKFEAILKKLPNEFKKAFKDNGLSTGIFIDDVQELLELYQKLYSLSNSGMNIDFNNVKDQVDELKTSIANVFNYDPSLFTEGFESQFNNIRDDFLKLFNNITQGTAMSESEIKRLVASLSDVGKQFENLKDKSNVLTNKKSIANALKTVQTELFQNSAMDKQFKKVLTSYRDELQNALDLYNKGMEKEAGLTKERLSEIVSGIMEVQGKIQASEKTGLSTINKIGKAIKTNFIQYVARYLSIQDIIRYLSNMVREVKNIDTALTELRKVSDATTERLQVSLKKSAETAKELGNSIDYVINITSDWARLGYDVDAAEELARVTTLFKNVGDNMSAEDASSFMISTLQGFQMTAEESESIVDKFNEVANNYAIDTAGIGEALQRSAASFNAANTSLSGAIAVITTANSVVQNPEQVGTAMKTLSARIRGSKAELEELGEEEENIVNLTSKLRAEVKAMTGFDIMADEETYKSIDEIIIGIGEHWKELTDIQQAALAEDLAGKRNSNVLIALLQNAEQVKKVYDTAESSAGSAMREQENYAKSIEYSIYRVKAIWQDMITKVLKSKDIKKLIDTTGDTLEKIGDSLENFAPLLTTIMNLLGGIIGLLGKLSKIGNGIPLLAGIGVAGYKLKNIDSDKQDIFKVLKNKISAELIKSKEKEIAATTASTIANKAETESEFKKAAAKKADAIASTEDAVATGAQTTVTAADTAVNNKNTTSIIKNTAEIIKNTAAKVANLVATHPIITGITVAVVAAAYAWYRYSHSLSNTIKQNKKLLESQKEELETIKETIDATNEKIKSLEELTEQYENAVEGSEEYYELANKIAELDPTLSIGYTSNGDAILADTEKIKEQIEVIKELRQEQLQQKKDNASNVINTSSNLLDNYKEQKKNYEDEIKRLEGLRDEEQQNLERLLTVDQLHDDDMTVQAAKSAVGMYQGMINNIKSDEEYKNVINNIQEQQKELIENYVYLFDEIPENLSTVEKNYEKAVRQFTLDIAQSSEKAMSSADFLSLYNSLENKVNKDILQDLFSIDNNISQEEYQKEANKIYNQLIESLAKSGFDINDNNKLALQVALKIDEESQRNYINAKNRFAQNLGVSGVNSRRVQFWYDKLSADEIKLVEKNVDELSQKIKFVSADNLVTTLDESLEYLKGINEEVKTLKEFTLQDISESVTSKLVSIESLYNSFNSDIVNGEKTRLDIDDVEGLRSSLVASEDNPLGVTSEQFEEFERVVSDGTHTIEEMQEAFDKLSTEFVDATLAINGYTDANKNLIKAQLEDAGYTKESVDAYVEYKSALLGIQEIADNTDFNFNTKNSVEEINKLSSAANNSSLAIQQYAAEILLASNYKDKAFDSSASIANLQALKTACGDTAPVIDLLIQLMNTYQRLQVAISSGQTQMINGLQAEADRLQAEIQKAMTVELEPVQLNTKATQEAKDAGKEAADEYVEAFEKELKELDDLRDSGIINEKDYLNRLQALYIKYFANRKEYIKEFKKYEKQYLEGMQALYEKAISAAITLLNDQKDDLEKAKDDAIDALEDAKDAEIEPINDHIKALEDEKDSLEKEREAMQKANDERERQINLQKAQYELERANSQRTRLIYKNGQMQYVQDYQEVRNAKKNLEDVIFEKNIAKLDNQIDNIDNQIEDLNKQLDAIEEKYDKLIEDTEKFYDAQIKGVQDLIDMWEKLQHQADLVDAYEALGNFGITANDILSGNLNVFNQIRDGYIGTFAGLSSDANAVAQAFGTTTDNALALKDAILGYDASTATFSDLANNIANVGNAATDAAGKVGGSSAEGEASAGGTLNGNLEQLGSKKEDIQEVTDAINGEENSLTSAMNEFGATSETVVSKVGSLFGSLAEKITNVGSKISDIINNAKSKFEVSTPNKSVQGGAGFTGTAYAGGKWTAGSKGLVGKALVGELGPEILVRNGKFEVIGSNGAEFTNIRSNDIVFNHKQSEELLKNGHINSRGKAYASGNANKFTALSPEELSKYTKLDFTKDLAEKLDFGNQKLMNIDKTVSTISNSKTVNNNNPVININGITIECSGLTPEDVQQEIVSQFTGLFTSAYQRAMTK